MNEAVGTALRPHVVRLPTPERPRVSVIILAWRNPDLLLRCLASLERHAGAAVSFETIILLNGATDEVRSVVRRGQVGARVLESGVNLGFAGGCNRASAAARGEFSFFLNDDAEVAQRCLEVLIETADAHPRAGAVGGLILFPDGTIQEAGSVVWDDGSTLGVGRGAHGDDPSYDFLRRVDYCSANGLLVRRSAWEAVGGMDESYFPAYYEDADLCLALQQSGHTVLFDPRAKIFHHEGRSSVDGFRLFLVLRNRRRFRAKWARELVVREPAAPTSAAAIERAVFRARGCPRRVLVIDDRLPDPSVGSGFGRMLEAIQDLAAAGAAVALFATDRRDGDPAVLRRLGVRLIRGDLDRHLATPETLYDAVVISRPHNFERYAAVIRRRQPRAVIIYDAEALFHARLEGKASLLGAEAMDPLRAEAASMRALEERIAREADRLVSVSVEEAERLRAIDGSRPVDVVFPTSASVSATTADFHARRDLGLVAGWLAGADSPNADGLDWFVRCVLPLIRARVPWMRLRVTGEHVPESIRRLAGPSVSFCGHVQDLSKFYDAMRAAIVPVRYGAGVKIKVVEALQHGVPVVTTSTGAQGLAGAYREALFLADGAEEFAARTVEMLEDDRAWSIARRRILDLASTEGADRGRSWKAILNDALEERRHEPLGIRAAD